MDATVQRICISKEYVTAMCMHVYDVKRTCACLSISISRPPSSKLRSDHADCAPDAGHPPSRKSKMPKARLKTKKAFPKKRRARPRTKRTPEDEENARRRRQRPKTRRPQPKMPRGPPQTISKGIASQGCALFFSKPLLRHLVYPMTEIFWILLFFLR